MDKININDFSEETRYVWKCPKCEQYNEECEDPSYEEEVTCEGCSETFEIEHS